MIYIFGDSHATSNFRNMKYQYVNLARNSLTMNRVGRDKKECIDFKNYNIQNGDTIVYQIGEVDCRCHIGKQIQTGRLLFEIITTLVNEFINSIIINCEKYQYLNIIICCIPPPMDQDYFKSIHGDIDLSFPFIGTNSERVQYTFILNGKLKQKCEYYNFTFFDYYNDYEDENKMLKPLLSDNNVHIMENSYLLRSFYKILNTLNKENNTQFLYGQNIAQNFSAYERVKVETKQVPLAIVHKIEEPLSKPDNKINLTFNLSNKIPRTIHFMSKMNL